MAKFFFSSFEKKTFSCLKIILRWFFIILRVKKIRFYLYFYWSIHIRIFFNILKIHDFPKNLEKILIFMKSKIEKIFWPQKWCQNNFLNDPESKSFFSFEILFLKFLKPKRFAFFRKKKSFQIEEVFLYVKKKSFQKKYFLKKKFHIFYQNYLKYIAFFFFEIFFSKFSFSKKIIWKFVKNQWNDIVHVVVPSSDRMVKTTYIQKRNL